MVKARLKLEKRASHGVEAKRAIDDFTHKLSVLTSRGDLNSDGIKALSRIVRLLNKCGMRAEAARLSRKLRDPIGLDAVLSLLSEVEEGLSD
ncbi:MAG: hypothetical protein QFX33_03160 [Candidatus Nezhaarchaeota archaeon]|nr:hypothetical protein [Candidatus Nezhaarchaeota archaeon]